VQQSLSAVQDNQRSEVIGEKTFGKGVVQYFFKMEDGSGIKLTIAKYLTPNYHDVTMQGGISPDVVCHDQPHGVLPTRDLDACIRQAVRHLSARPGIGSMMLQASR
jgi:C-terminal processing protease CtpA/Prc